MKISTVYSAKQKHPTEQKQKSPAQKIFIVYAVSRHVMSMQLILFPLDESYCVLDKKMQLILEIRTLSSLKVQQMPS